jgi:predicted ester cyclase
MLPPPHERMVGDMAAALARSLYHLLDHHRLDDAVRALDPHFRGHGCGSDRAGFQAEMATWFAGFPDLRISVRQLVTEETRVAVWIVLRGTHQGRFAGVSPSGRTIEIAGVDLLEERGGAFVEAWSLRDLNGLWIQLGALPGSVHDQRPPIPAIRGNRGV